MSFDGMHFLRPEAFFLLVLLPVVWWLAKRLGARAGNWSQVIAPHLLQKLAISARHDHRFQASRWLPVLWTIAVIGIAGPSVTRSELPVFKRADALVIIFDLSASMLAADVQPSRHQRARQKILDLLEQRSEGVTGLVVYAGDAHVVTPLTDDVATIANLLPALTPDIMPLPGADLDAAITIACELLTSAGVANGHLLLITDGIPSIDTSAAKSTLLQSGASLAILGIGTSAGAPVPLPDGGFLRDDRGELVVPTLDAEQLRRVAAGLNAPLSLVTLDNRDLDLLTENGTFSPLEAASLERRTDTWLDQAHWIAALLAVLLLPFYRRGIVIFALLTPLLGSPEARADLWDDLWQTRDQQGAEAFAENDPGRAAQLFERHDWRGVAEYDIGNYSAADSSFSEGASADDWYNRGNARALAGDLLGALEAYDESLNLRPDAADAVANRALVEALLQQQDQQKNDAEQQDQSDPNSDDTQNSESAPSSQDPSDQTDSETNPSENSASDQQNDPQSDSNNQSDNGETEKETSPPPRAEQSLNDNGDTLDADTASQMERFDQALEEQQALEQWLRRVPDDPGGLLRRKFRYQTLQRIRNGEEPEDDIRW